MAYNENYTAIGDKIEAIGNFFSQNRFDSCVSTLNTHIKLFIFGWKKNKLKKKKVELSQCAQFHVTGVVNAGNFKVGNLLSIQFRFICVGWHIKLAHNRFISELIERNNKFYLFFAGWVRGPIVHRECTQLSSYFWIDCVSPFAVTCAALWCTHNSHR